MTVAGYRFLADATLMAHAAFVLFVVVGQALILAGWARRWQWTRARGFRLVHLGAIVFVALEAAFGVACPLTVLENRWRRRAGGVPYAESFVAHWVARLLFYTAPEWVFTLSYAAFALVTVWMLWVYPPRR